MMKMIMIEFENYEMMMMQNVTRAFAFQYQSRTLSDSLRASVATTNKMVRQESIIASEPVPTYYSTFGVKMSIGF